jgi:hypothetical protein
LSLAAGLLVACGSDAGPTWSPEVQAAIKAMDAAADAGSISTAAQKLQDALMAEKSPTVARDQALKSIAVLKAELDVATQEPDQGVGKAKAQWKELRSRMMGGGQPKGSAKEAKGRLTLAMAALDQAIDRKDSAAARSALGDVQRAAGEVADKSPTPIQIKIGEIMNMELDPLSSTLLSTSDWASAKSQWERSRDQLKKLIE